MRDHMERFVVLPFSIGCASESSVAVASSSEPKKPTKPPVSRIQGEEGTSNKEKMKNAFGFLAFSKPSISSGMYKLIRGIRSLSQVFAYKEENELEREIEIGYPTDVKHVTHIGLDGTTTTSPIKGWENLKAPEVISFPSISLRQFDLAMAAQANEPLIIHPSKLA